MEPVMDDASSEFVATLEWQITEFISKRASRNPRKFARVTMRDLVKATDCWDERFIEAAVGRMIAAGVIEPASREPDGPIEGFVCPSASRGKTRTMPERRESHKKLTAADKEFLCACGVMAE